MAVQEAGFRGMAGAVPEDRVSVATQRQLIWWRFRKHHLAMVSGVVIILFYLVALGADFLSTTDPERSDAHLNLIPPQAIKFFDDGQWSPHICTMTGGR